MLPPSDCLVSDPGHSLEGSYTSAEVQLVYSTAPADWENQCVGEDGTPFPVLLNFTLDTYLILLSVNQGSIKYHF